MTDIQKEIKEALEKASYGYQVYEMDDNDDHQQTNLIGSRDWEDDVEFPTIKDAYLHGNAYIWLLHQQELIEQQAEGISKLKKVIHDAGVVIVDQFDEITKLQEIKSSAIVKIKKRSI